MIRLIGTVFAGLLGLAFGSFLNVCLSRWPQGESVVQPRSHCRSCGRTLAWWENVPLVSWLALRGRCRSCGAWIGWRYLVVELAVGGLWATSGWQILNPSLFPDLLPVSLYDAVVHSIGNFVLFWLLVALAALDAENFWLPNRLTLPAVALGFFYFDLRATLSAAMPTVDEGSMKYAAERAALGSILSILAASGLVLLVRWTYWFVRRREGIGMGDVKLMAMLGAWLGLPGALLSFGIGVVLGAVVGVVVLVRGRRDLESAGLTKLPLGTFLCIGGIVSALWGERIITAYVRWAGF